MNLRKTMGLLILSGAFLGFVACGEKKDTGELRARISSVLGQVTVNGKNVPAGTIIQTGDKIATGANGRADLIIQKRGGLTIRANTELTFDMADGKLGLQLDKGDLIAAFHKIPSNRDVAVTTPTAIAGVRGTHFFIKVHDKDHTYVCTCNGAVHYQGHGHDEGEVTEAAHHKAHEFKRAGGQVVKTDGAMLHHQDHHMERNAALISKDIDWDKVH